MRWTKAEAQQAAQLHLKNNYGLGEDAVVFLEDQTLERPYGWVFLFQSRRFIETGDIMHAFGGNGPLIADAARHRILEGGTASSLEKEIRRVEIKAGLLPEK